MPESLALCLDYETELPKLQTIIKRSKSSQWVVEDIDWDAEVGDSAYARILEWHGVLRSEYIRGLSDKKKEGLARQLVAFDYAQILHGEQAAMMLAGQLTNTLDDLDARLFAAQQVRDEARHVEALRALVQRVGPIYPCGAVLKETVEGLLTCDVWPKQVLGLQLFLEARALLSFRQSLLFVDDPVFQDVIRRVERDESQHVAFGIQYVNTGLEAMDEAGREGIVQYARWLDKHVWNMTQPSEFRAAFDECDLDFDAFAATFRGPTFKDLTANRESRQRADLMHGQFRNWFHKMLRRTGVLRSGEELPGVNHLGGASHAHAREGADIDHEVLPWAVEADELL